MISVDTNVIVRLLTDDNQPQFKRAMSLFEKASIFISTIVILETEWVLRYAYHFKPLIIADAIEWHKKDLDFADALHLAKSQASRSFATFDKKLIKKALKLINTPVLEP